MLALKEDFEKQIQDLTVRLEMFTNSFEIERDSAEQVVGNQNTMTADEFSEIGRLANLSQDKPDRLFEKPSPSSAIKRRKGKSEIADHVLPRTDRHVEDQSRIAFFAVMDAPNQHLGIDHDIVFDNVYTNYGNAYNAHHGIFIAPVDGVYVFTCSLYTYTPTYAQFVVNGTVVAKFELHGNNAEPQSSQTIIVKLQQGQDVIVQNTILDATIYGAKYSTFAGFLLYEGLSETPVLVG